MISNFTLFGVEKPIIGMVHLLPTVGYPTHPGMEALINNAIADAQALQAGGANGILVENDFDQPHTITVRPEQQDCISEVVREVRRCVSVPVGVNVLLNDWKASLDIAQETGCSFVRIDVFVDRVDCPSGQGIIEPESARIMHYRHEIGADHIAIFADIQVKHKILLEKGKSLATSAQQAIDAGADALIVSGALTGIETPMKKILEVKSAFPHFPLFVGSGLTATNVYEQLQHADGAIVGTWLKNSRGVVDEKKVQQLLIHSMQKQI